MVCSVSKLHAFAYHISRSEAKGYDTFCPVGEFIPKDKLPQPGDIELWLKVNGEFKQKGSTNLMLFPYV